MQLKLIQIKQLEVLDEPLTAYQLINQQLYYYRENINYWGKFKRYMAHWDPILIMRWREEMNILCICTQFYTVACYCKQLRIGAQEGQLLMHACIEVWTYF